MKEWQLSEWQPSGTEPRTGETFLKGALTKWRWRAYAATGRYGRRGVEGRFQVRSRKGGWHNEPLPDGPWLPDRWSNILTEMLRVRSSAIAAALTKNNALLASLDRSLS